MRATEHAQRKDRGQLITEMTGEYVRRRPAGQQVGGSVREQVAVERAAELATCLALPTEQSRGASGLSAVGFRVAHGGHYGRPTWAAAIAGPELAGNRRRPPHV